MAEGVLYNFAEGILQRLASEVVNEVGLVWGVKEKLLGLEDTMSMIKDVLLDAQEQRITRRHIKNWISRLEDVVQDFEDLLDYMETDDASRRQGRSNKVRNFFSSSNRVAFRFKLAHWVEDIKKKLAEVQADKKEFQLEVRLEEAPLLASHVRFEQTHSFVPEEEVIGRDLDKSNIINKLLNVDETNENVSTIAIVGCGGMGKTTIAQDVSSDEKVKNHFQLKMWVCVSDVFVVKTVVVQIIKSATNKSPTSSEMDQMQKQLRNELKDKRYLLVLDDVWNEDYSKWKELKDLLLCGAKGSRIIVTTRSTVVADITESKVKYNLDKLNDEFSWSLFKKMACRKENEGNESIEEMRDKILKKCGGIPIVIKTMGSMLRFKNAETEWQLVIDKELSKVPQYADNILPKLELSYNHLPSHLKHCFAYCSLFPKDYEFDVQEMIRFWMALGFVNSPDQSQPLEDVGFEYFKELLSRSFFQQVKTNKWGDIISCKMHDFIHDLAIKEAGTECISFNNSEGRNISKRTRHVSFDDGNKQAQAQAQLLAQAHAQAQAQAQVQLFLANMLKAERIRCILTKYLDDPTLIKIISSLKRIRLLNLNSSSIETVPKSIAKLMQLRYLNLSRSDVTTLPNSLCRLQNLQTLLLNSCDNFEKWPKDFGKLVNLRHLEFCDCDKLTEWPEDMQKLVNLRHLNFEKNINDVLRKSMPRGLSQLTNLQTLSPLEIDVVSMEFGIAQMGELNNLRGGELKIVNLRHGNKETSKANLKKKKFDSIKLKWLKNVEVDEATATTEETTLEDQQPHQMEVDVAKADEITLEDLQPHQNLKELSLYRYCGNKCPNWFAFLINVVSVKLNNCTNLQSLPQFAHLPALKELKISNLPALKELKLSNLPALKELKLSILTALKELKLSNLPALKELKLSNLPALVYISSNDRDELICRASSSSSKLKSFFPSLKELSLENMPRLKGWWNINNEDNNHLKLPEFPCLSRLKIMQCPGLSCMPLFPSLDCLHLEGTSWRGALQSTLKMKDIEGGPQIQNDAKSQNQDSTTSTSSSSSISNMIPPVSKLNFMYLENIEDVESLPTSSKSMISLKHLEIKTCSKLKSIFPGIQHLTSLQRLYICDCDNLNSSGLEGIGSLTSLEALNLTGWKGLSTLPQEIYGLSRSLKKLEICKCPVFDSLPEKISSLISLKQLILYKLPKLKSLPRPRFLANIQQLNFWYSRPGEDFIVKEFIKSKHGVFQSQATDNGTNRQSLRLQIADCPHLEEFIRNSGFFSLSFEGTRREWARRLTVDAVIESMGFLLENQDGIIEAS